MITIRPIGALVLAAAVMLAPAVPARAVRIVSGEHARRKRIAIDGISAERARVILGR